LSTYLRINDFFSFFESIDGCDIDSFIRLDGGSGEDVLRVGKGGGGVVEMIFSANGDEVDEQFMCFPKIQCLVSVHIHNINNTN
jgi:hypothetical protein